MSEAFLSGQKIAISISDSPDLAHLGMSPRALEHAVIELARFLLRAGATICYGGHLGEGFTINLFELVRRYRREDPYAPPVTNYVAWSVHRAYDDDFIAQRKKEYADAATIALLDQSGKRVELHERSLAEVTTENAAASLTGMRRQMAEDCDARVLMGGKVANFSGSMPGIAEEAGLMLKYGKRLVLVGGYGGCTRDIATHLGIAEKASVRTPADVGNFAEKYERGLAFVKEFARPELLPNENRELADNRNLPQIVKLVLHALRDLT
jgi:hypothetical protein